MRKSLSLLLSGWQLGWAMARHDSRRMAMSVAAIAMAVLAVMMEVGFFNAIGDSQSHTASLLNADLVVMDRRVVTITVSSFVRQSAQDQLRRIPGVMSAFAIDKDVARIRNPQTGAFKPITVFAFPEGDETLKSLGAELRQINQANTVVMDRKSRDIYGQFELGQPVEINGREFRLGGFIDLGPDLLSDGAVMMSSASWSKNSSTYPSMILVRLSSQGDKSALLQSVIQAIPPDLMAMTPDQLAQKEYWFLLLHTPVGIVFAVAVLVALLILAGICGQILFNTMIDQRRQFAVLEAMGFPVGLRIGVISLLVTVLAVAGFAVGSFVAFPLLDLISRMSSLVIDITLSRLCLVQGLVWVTCALGAGFAQALNADIDPVDMDRT